MSPAPTADHLLCAVLRGDAPQWPQDAQPALQEDVCTQAEWHGVAALVYAHAAAQWPAEVARRLGDVARAQAMWDMRHQQRVMAALATLHDAGVPALLLKGTPLAYLLYRDPALRRRGDTDILVWPHQRVRADDALQAAGWTRVDAPMGDYVSYQSTYLVRLQEQEHALDLHWRINNAQSLAGLFAFDELQQRARAVPALGPHAHAPDDADALLIACMHRATHEHNPYAVGDVRQHAPDRLIWLLDIDLLARRLPERGWSEVLARAAAKQLRTVVLDGLQAARGAFGTAIPDTVEAALRRAANERPARYLQAGRMRQFAMDLCALPWRGRLRWCAEMLFPSPQYIRHKYPGRRAPLAWLYLLRATGGIARRLAPARSAGS